MFIQFWKIFSNFHEIVLENVLPLFKTIIVTGIKIEGQSKISIFLVKKGICLIQTSDFLKKNYLKQRNPELNRSYQICFRSEEIFLASRNSAFQVKKSFLF